MNQAKKITLCAMMVAMAVVLAFVSKIIPIQWLNGGSITLASMVPIIVASIILGGKWGILSGVVYAIIQMLMGFYPPPTRDFISFLLVVMLDYILPFGCLGLAGVFFRLMKRKNWAIPISAFAVTAIRFLCHFLSGIIIWGSSDPSMGAALFSLVYNGGYMIPEIIISTVVSAALIPVIRKLK